MNRRSLILAAAALAVAAAVSAQEPLADLAAGAAAPEMTAAMKNLTALRDREAGAGYRRHSVTFRATLSDGGVLRQPAVVTVGFDMEAAPRLGGDRAIRNLRYAVELVADGGLSLPGYVMRSAAPERRPFAYSTETREGVDFTIEARAHVDPGADGTVLKWALGRDAAGTLYGNDATLMMHPYCSRDLKSCRLGLVAGVADTGTLPTYWLRSDEIFSLAPEL
ncbi:MAG: hypothetical protein PHS14_16790 [Elusimicrobia bacterium]|nr:hypothetical protein [Elusimicrobiota bacterium]